MRPCGVAIGGREGKVVGLGASGGRRGSGKAPAVRRSGLQMPVCLCTLYFCRLLFFSLSCKVAHQKGGKPVHTRWGIHWGSLGWKNIARTGPRWAPVISYVRGGGWTCTHRLGRDKAQQLLLMRSGLRGRSNHQLHVDRREMSRRASLRVAGAPSRRGTDWWS